jgi:hypothetical protein
VQWHVGTLTRADHGLYYCPRCGGWIEEQR